MDPSDPLDVTGISADVLRSLVTAHRDAQEVAQRCSARLKEAIVDALDSGWSQRDVAELVGVSRARLHAIVCDVASRAS